LSTWPLSRKKERGGEESVWRVGKRKKNSRRFSVEHLEGEMKWIHYSFLKKGKKQRLTAVYFERGKEGRGKVETRNLRPLGKKKNLTIALGGGRLNGGKERSGRLAERELTRGGREEKARLNGGSLIWDEKKGSVL